MSVQRDAMMMAEDAAGGATDDGGICRWLQQMIWRRSLLWMSLCTDCDRLSYLRMMAPFGPIIWCMPWCIWWHLALYIWYIGHSLLYLCVQKNITFMFVSMHSLFDYDRKDDMIRDSLVTSSISNGPLFIWEYSSHQAPGHSLADEGYERARNTGLLKCVMTFRGRIWWLTP